MSDQTNQTFEHAVLIKYPDVRTQVVESAEFQTWQGQLPSIVLDDVTYYIRGGDMLRDEDQVIFEWARRSGLLSQNMIDEVGSQEGG